MLVLGGRGQGGSKEQHLHYVSVTAAIMTASLLLGC